MKSAKWASMHMLPLAATVAGKSAILQVSFDSG